MCAPVHQGSAPHRTHLGVRLRPPTPAPSCASSTALHRVPTPALPLWPRSPGLSLARACASTRCDFVARPRLLQHVVASRDSAHCFLQARLHERPDVCLREQPSARHRTQVSIAPSKAHAEIRTVSSERSQPPAPAPSPRTCKATPPCAEASSPLHTKVVHRTARRSAVGKRTAARSPAQASP
jgi:hypothetical protein